jgi:restriction endonuclease S subunit
LFPTRRPALRKCAIAPFAGITGEKILVLRSKDPLRLDPEFLPYLLASDGVRRRVIERAIGSVTPHFRWRDLASHEFLLPPLDEQQRIVAVLTSFDGAAESLSVSLRQVHLLALAHLNDFFTSRIATAVPLTKIAQVISGGTPSKADTTLWGGGRPWASGKDIKSRTLTRTEDTLTEKGWAVATVAPRGATLIVVRGMILEHTFPAALCERDTAFNQDLRALVAGDAVDPRYLFLWTEWSARWFLARTAASSHGTKRIEGNLFDQALVPVPERAEQVLLVDRHQKLIDAEDAMKARFGRLQALRRSFTDAIFESSE